MPSVSIQRLGILVDAEQAIKTCPLIAKMRLAEVVVALTNVQIPIVLAKRNATSRRKVQFASVALDTSM